jgi:hypothetical protein
VKLYFEGLDQGACTSAGPEPTGPVTPNLRCVSCLLLLMVFSNNLNGHQGNADSKRQEVMEKHGLLVGIVQELLLVF